MFGIFGRWTNGSKGVGEGSAWSVSFEVKRTERSETPGASHGEEVKHLSGQH